MTDQRRPLNRLTVRGFKSIRALEDFALRPGLNVLIGGNGSGKSNFIEVFGLLDALNTLSTFVALRGGAERLLFRGSKESQAIEVGLDFRDQAYGCRFEPTVDDSLVFMDADVRPQAARVVPITWLRRVTPLGAPVQIQTPTETSREEIEPPSGSLRSRWRTYHFQDTTVESRRRVQKAPEHDYTFFRRHAENLAPFLLRLRERHPDRYDAIRATIRLAYPSFGDFAFRVDELPTGERPVFLTWTERGHDYPYLIGQMSDGTLRFVCLAVALLQPDPPSTIIVDEPELGLHPYAITLLGDLFKRAAHRAQVIVATQSSLLLDEFVPEDVIVVDREDGASIFRRLAGDDLAGWLKDYSLGEVWRKNLIDGTPSR